MLCRLFIRLSAVLLMLGILPAYADNNMNPLKLTPTSAAITGSPLVEKAKVNVILSDFWGADIISWQLTTTEATSNEPAWTSSNWSTKHWPNNECSANAPHSGVIAFTMNDSTTSSDNSDNKLQKLLSMVQVAQLTGMQMTIIGDTVTGDNTGAECVVTNIKYVILRNTTY